MKEAKGYTLWLVPKKKEYDVYESVIRSLAKKYNSKVFQPHITLLGDIMDSKRDVLLKARQLAQLINPFAAKMEKIGSALEYFRCLYVLFEKHPELMKANDFARRFFDREDDPPFMPHLSLLYGYFEDRIKEQAIKSMDDLPEEFVIDSLAVAYTEGGPEDWKIIEEIPFGYMAKNHRLKFK